MTGTYATILFGTMGAPSYVFVAAAFLSFFIATSLQFDACRVYMEGLVTELDDATTRPSHAVGLELMFEHIVCFQVAAKE